MQAKLVKSLGGSMENAGMRNEIDLSSLNNELNFSKKDQQNINMSIEAFESHKKRNQANNFVSFSQMSCSGEKEPESMLAQVGEGIKGQI